MSNIKHIPKGVLSFLALFVLISCFIGSIPVAAADDDLYEFDEFWFGSSPPSSNFSDFSYTLYSFPHFFSSSDHGWFGIIFEFSEPVPISNFSGKHVYCRTSKIPFGSGDPVVSQLLTFYDSNDNNLATLGVNRSYSSLPSSVIDYTFTFGNSNSGLLVSKAFFALQPTAGHMGELAVYTFSTDVPYSPGSPEPEPPTPATGEWQAFTQFIFGIFGTMGSIINNLLAAGGLSSIFFGFVFGIPIANFIIFLIEEIFDLEPYDPSSSWRREEHSLKELRPADYNNFPGDPPSNRIGF